MRFSSRDADAAAEISRIALLPPSRGVAAAELSSLLPRFALLSPSGGAAAVELSRSVYVGQAPRRRLLYAAGQAPRRKVSGVGQRSRQ